MGIYSTEYNTSAVAMNEAYATPYGALKMALDAKVNDLALFESLIQRDLQEATATVNADSYMMEEVQLVTENAISNLWDKVKELVKKIKEKIKAIFNKVITKLGMLFTRDNAQLVKKYQKLVLGKDLSDMTVKNYQKIKVADPSAENILHLDMFTFCRGDKFNLYKKTEDIAKNTNKKDNYLAAALKNDLTKEYTDSEFRQELEDVIFDTKETALGISQEEIRQCINILSGKNTINNLKKKETNIQKSLTDLEKNANTRQKEILDNNDDEKQDIKLARVNAHITEINNAQSACSTAFSCWIGLVKKAIAQSRRVFTMAATYKPKESVNSSAYIDAVGFVAESEVMEYFEDFDD